MERDGRGSQQIWVRVLAVMPDFEQVFLFLFRVTFLTCKNGKNDFSLGEGKEAWGHDIGVISSLSSFRTQQKYNEH